MGADTTERTGTTLTDAEREQVARELAAAVEGEVRFGRHDRMLYATDASLYQVEPIGVVIPASVADAERACAFCAERGIPVLPRGGGTSLAGQCVNNAVVIDFSAHCRSVGEVNENQSRVRVEPGVTLDELNEEIARRGRRLFFGPDVATSRHANIGGMIGNNSAGARSILYGRTVEHVLGLEVALFDQRGRAYRATLDEAAATRDERVRDITARVVDVVQRYAGPIRDRFPKTVRQSSGYNLDLILKQIERRGDPLSNVNLASLICGSEGTLATTLGAELNLVPTPVARGLAVVSFPTLRDAVEAVNAILDTKPSAVEALDELVISLARRNTTHRGSVDLLPRIEGGDPGGALYVEYSAFDSADELVERFEALRAVVGGRPVSTFTGAGDMQRAWALRKAAEPLLHGLPGLRKPITFVEDTAVPPERLPEFVERFRGIVERHGTRAAYFAHASVGCLHIRPMLNPHDPDDLEHMRRIAVEVADLVHEFGGTISGEHGDGRVRSPLIERIFGPELMNAFREIKAIFDPDNLLNPGNIVDPGPVKSITTKLRVLPEQTPVGVPETETYYEYDDQGGFGGAVEMCNGAGVCRKKRGGTMCPSYMGTLDERHSTRGRGNALRLAITGQFGRLGRADWADEETIRTLDLCLSCKACKSECPSNVDIARLKAEYTAQRRDHGERTPIGERLLSSVRLLNASAALAPKLATALSNLPPMRAVANRMFKLAPERSLPPFGPALTRRVKQRRGGAPSGHRGDVALFVDCFAGFGESNIGEAAVTALEALGYRVRLIDAGCCMRPAISMGLLKKAIRGGEALYEKLEHDDDDDSVEAFLFMEPSCLSAIDDDLPMLRLKADKELRRRIASRSMLVEQFITRALEDRAGPVEPDGPRVILHAHCHQKALWGEESSAEMVRRLVGDRLETLDSGCCGMAGAFGYTRDRYDLSMAIGELTLLPAARAAQDDEILLAPGASCRHQIKDGADRHALHPVELAAEVLKRSNRSES